MWSARTLPTLQANSCRLEAHPEQARNPSLPAFEVEIRSCCRELMDRWPRPHGCSFIPQAPTILPTVCLFESQQGSEVRGRGKEPMAGLLQPTILTDHRSVLLESKSSCPLPPTHTLKCMCIVSSPLKTKTKKPPQMYYTHEYKIITMVCVTSENLGFSVPQSSQNVTLQAQKSFVRLLSRVCGSWH